jgi:hypothetical protein
MRQFISKTEASEIVGCNRRSIYNWLDKGKIAVTTSGKIPRSEFERTFTPHVLISRLRETLNQLPPHSLAGVLIEVLSPDYVLALANVLNGSNNLPEETLTGRDCDMGNVVA